MKNEVSGGAWRQIGDATSVPIGQLRQVEVDGAAVVLVHTEREYLAFQGLCSHEAYPMADGFLEQTRLVCALHGSSFDLMTGQVGLGPAERPLAKYEVRLRRGLIEIFVPEIGLSFNE